MPDEISHGNPGGPSTTLIAQLQQHDAEGWQRFLDLYGPLVYSWCRTQWGLSAPDAADVLQDVAIQVLQHIASYRGGGFAAWLWAITRSRVSRHRQQQEMRAAGGTDAQQRLAQIPDPAAEEAPLQGPLTGVLARAVERVRARCAPTTWQAFWQVVVEGRQVADVAADLGQSTNVVYVAVSRLTSRLRAELDSLE